MNENKPLVCVIDDESSIRQSLSNLLRSAGLKVQAFASAQEFLTKRFQEAPSCLVLDVQLPGISGLDLQQELANGNAQIPIIFMTGYGDIPMTVRAMKSGRFRISHQTFPRRRFRSEVAPSSPAIWRSGGHRSRSGSVANVQKSAGLLRLTKKSDLIHAGPIG